MVGRSNYHALATDNEIPADERLNDQQALFVDWYCATLNQTEAYRKAGYVGDEDSLAAHASRLVSTGKVARAIQEKLQNHGMSAAEVLARLTDLSRADMSLAITETGDIDVKLLRRQGKGHWIKKYKRRTYTTMDTDGNERLVTETELELHDSLEALKYMGKFHGLVQTRLKIEVDTDAQAIAAIKAGHISYDALVQGFDEQYAKRLFLAAQVSVPSSTPADTVEGEYSELESPAQPDTDSATDV